MPTYEFWIDDRQSIDWVLDRPPAPGEVYDFGLRGLWRVVGAKSGGDPVFTDGKYAVVRADTSDGKPVNAQP